MSSIDQINRNKMAKLNVMGFSSVKNWTRLIRGQFQVSGRSRQDQGSKPEVLTRICTEDSSTSKTEDHLE